MASRGLLAGAFALVATTVSCAPPAEGDPDGPPEPERTVPLELSVDHVDVSHGALRVRATMVDGSADVSLRLGEPCEPREVGRGVATRRDFSWSLDEREVADALRCNLVVLARGRDDRGVVVATARLDVGITVAAPDEDPGAEGAAGPQLAEVGRSTDALEVAFQGASPRASLFAGDRWIEAAARGGDDPGGAGDDPGARFAVPLAVIARALIAGRSLRIDGHDFALTVSVGAAELEGDAPESPDPGAEEPENPEPENPEPESAEPPEGPEEPAGDPEGATTLELNEETP